MATFIFPRPQKYGGFWTRECSTGRSLVGARSQKRRLEREEEKTHPKIEKAM